MRSDVVSFCCNLPLCTMVEIDSDRKGKFLLHQLEQQRGFRAHMKGGKEEGNYEGGALFFEMRGG